MDRACGASSLPEEKHALLATAHFALAAKCRLEAVEETREAVRWARELLVEAKKELSRQLESASAEVLEDKATMSVVLDAFGRGFERCGPDLQSDPELILRACKAYGFIFRLASPARRADRDNGFALESASQELKADREVVLAALESEPFALRFASDDLRRDRELILAALRRQERRYALAYEENVLAGLLDEAISDRELLLEAARADGGILANASLELRKDKDFVLKIMRRAPLDDLEVCYAAAHESLQASTSRKDFAGACCSALAQAGEDAPVLTITMSLTSTHVLAATANVSDDSAKAGFEAEGPEEGEKEKKVEASSSCENATASISCEVSLLSGSSFSCRLPDDPATDRSNHPTGCNDSNGSSNGSNGPSNSNSSNSSNRANGSNGSSRPHGSNGTDECNGSHGSNGTNGSTGSTADEPDRECKRRRRDPLALTVGQLAELVRHELLVQKKKIEWPLPRIFMVLAIQREAAGDFNSIPVTPWDWKRPLSDFCS